MSAREDDVVGRARVHEDGLAVAGEDGAARGGDAEESDALVLGALRVVVAVDDLEEVEPGAQDDQDGEDQAVDDADPHSQVLCLVLEFHGLN